MDNLHTYNMDLLVFSHPQSIACATLLTSDIILVASPSKLSLFQVSEACSIFQTQYDGEEHSIIQMIHSGELVSLQCKMGVNMLYHFDETSKTLIKKGEYSTGVFGFAKMEFSKYLIGIREEQRDVAMFDFKSGQIIHRFSLQKCQGITSYCAISDANYKVERFVLFTAHEGWKISKHSLLVEPEHSPGLGCEAETECFLVLPCAAQEIQIVLDIVESGGCLLISVRQDPHLYMLGTQKLQLLGKVSLGVKNIRNLTLGKNEQLIFSDGGKIWSLQKDRKKAVLIGELKQSKNINSLTYVDGVVAGSSDSAQLFHLQLQ